MLTLTCRVVWLSFQGIEWIHVEYFNNSVICELIEKVRGESVCGL